MYTVQSKRQPVVTWIAFLLLSIGLSTIWLSFGHFNLKYDWGFAIYNWHNTWAGTVSAWNDLFLGQAITINLAWLPAFLLVTFGTVLHLGPLVGLPLLVVLLPILAGVGFTKLLSERDVPWLIALLAGVVYAFSPTWLIRSAIGFLFYLLAYALTPWFITYWWRAAGSQAVNLKLIALSAVIMSLISAQPQFVVMLSLFILIDLLLFPDKAYLKRSLLAVLLIILTLVIVHFPWLYLLFRDGGQNVTASNNLGGSLATITSLPHSLWRTLFGADHQIFFPVFDHLLAGLLYATLVAILVLLAVIAPLVRPKREVKVIFVLLALSWLLALGTQIPTSSLFTWLYQHLPFTNIFREVYHFAWLTIFSLCFLLAFTWQFLATKISNRRGRFWALSLTLLSIAIWLKPYWSNQLADYVTNHDEPKGYQEIVAQDEESVGRLQRSFFLPSLGFIKYKDDPKPGATNTDVLAISTGRSQLPFQSSLLDFPTPAQAIRNVALLSVLGMSEVPAADYLRPLAVNTIFVRPDLESEYNQLFKIDSRSPVYNYWHDPNYASLLNQQPKITLNKEYDGVLEYKVSDSQPLLSLATTPTLAAYDWTSLANESSDAVFYAEDLKNQLKSAQLDSLPANNLSTEDAVASQLTNYNYLPSWQFEADTTPLNGWVRQNAIWWQDQALATIKDNFLFTDGERELSSEIDLAAGAYQILVKIWHGSQAQSLSLAVGDWQQSLSTNSEHSTWQWSDLGQHNLAGKVKLTITSQGQTGIAQLLIVPEQKWSAANDWWQKREVKTNWQPTGETDTLLVTKKSSNLYQLHLQIDQERLLIFRQGFDNGWRLKLDNRQILEPLPVDGYAMAFIVPAGNNNGELVFNPQKTYTTLLVLAGVWLMALWLIGTWRSSGQTPNSSPR